MTMSIRLLAVLLLYQVPSVLPAEEIRTDLLVVGATESGWAAAIQAARLGVKSVTIVHDGDWLGGQFTEQSLACVDENKGVGLVGWGVDWHPMKRSFRRSGLFKELMDRIEAFNSEKYGSPMPGRPFHGPSTFRPAEAESVFKDLLQPYVESGQVRFIRRHYPVRADVDRAGERPRLTGLWFIPTEADPQSAPDLHVSASITIDASDWGDVVQVSGAAFECGPDPESRYGEPSAPQDLSDNPPNEMNPITWAMIVVEAKQETPIPRPPRFDDRNYPRATHLSLAAYRDLKWDQPNPGLGAILHWPDAGKESPRQLSVYTVRRIVDGYASPTGQTIILLNYMNGQDYPLERLPEPVVDQLEAIEPGASLKNIVLMTRRQRDVVFADAKQHALGVLYHLQNFVHERAPDKTNSFRKFTLSDEFGTSDRLPPKPYIRESLRLKAQYMMREQDARNRDGLTKEAAQERYAAILYPDGLFAWQFHYDFHRTGRTYLSDEGAAGPWIDYHKPNRHTSFLSDRSLFPLRSFVPVKMDGLLGAQKNLGYSSMVSAAIRLHDQCIAVGQAAGAIAVVSLRSGELPREFAYRRDRLEEVRHALCGEARDFVPLIIWPFRDLDPSDECYVAANRLAALRVIPLSDTEVDFRPDEPASTEWCDEIITRTALVKIVPNGLQRPHAEQISRGDFCRKWWQAVSLLPDRPFERKSPTDADSDGIPDADDPLLFTSGGPLAFKLLELPPERDGLPSRSKVPNARSFNFCGAGTKPVPGFVNDYGNAFDASRGFGWTRDISANHRRRDALSGIERDTFLFTRDRDRWECQLDNGTYRITICVGDSGHEQLQQRLTIEGVLTVDDVTTAPREFAEREVVVAVSDGRLTVDLGSGRPESNTCLNWLRIEPE